MPSTTNADRWHAQAAQAVATAVSMTDPAMSRVLWQIAISYRAMAEQAASREAGEIPRPMTGKSYGPEALAAICGAFDGAWRLIAPTAGSDRGNIDNSRAELAAALLSVADEDSRDEDQRGPRVVHQLAEWKSPPHDDHAPRCALLARLLALRNRVTSWNGLPP